VRFVVLGEDDALLVLAVQALADLAGQIKLLLQPKRHGLGEGLEALGANVRYVSSSRSNFRNGLS
jgi:hypothetical protein